MPYSYRIWIVNRWVKPPLSRDGVESIFWIFCSTFQLHRMLVSSIFGIRRVWSLFSLRCFVFRCLRFPEKQFCLFFLEGGGEHACAVNGLAQGTTSGDHARSQSASLQWSDADCLLACEDCDDQDSVDLVREGIRELKERPTNDQWTGIAEALARMLVEEALASRSTDNVTYLVLFLLFPENFPLISSDPELPQILQVCVLVRRLSTCESRSVTVRRPHSDMSF